MQKATWIDHKVLAKAEGKIVKADLYARLVDAKACVMQAQVYADRIRADIHLEVDKARAKGWEAGEKKAREEFATQMATTVMRLEATYMGLEARLVNTVMNALQTVLGNLDEKLVLEKLVRQAIRVAGQEKRLSLRVSAEQFNEANQILAAILAEYPHIEFIDVMKDPNMQKGGCVLESEYGAVDGSLNSHLMAIRQSLISVFAGKREQGAGQSVSPNR